MLTGECRAYIVEMAQAETPHARDAIQAHYGRLLQEREETCPCNVGYDWIRISPANSGPSKRTPSNRIRM